MSVRSRVEAGSRMEPSVISNAQLTDEQWALISDLFPQVQPCPRGGRPRADSRRCLEGILWILKSGSRWKDLPRGFPAYSTCWRRFQAWSLAGLWETIWRRLVGKLEREGSVDHELSIADGTFCPAKKGVIA